MKKITTKKINVVASQEYIDVLHNIKLHIQHAQVKAMLNVNTELIKLYWHIGQTISMQQKIHGWGSNLVESLAQDLQNSFPGMAGFSRANVFKMKLFYTTYEKVSQAVRQLDDLPIFSIPWGQNVVLLTKIEDIQECLWYAQQAIENGWSRSILEMQIDSRLFHRQGKAITNFKTVLPSPDSDMAQQAFKDPYMFDFLMLSNIHKERDIEQGLIDNVLNLLLEMGKGFALYGRQYHLLVGKKDYYIDLLFYHTKLKCYVVVELKARELESHDVGQLNFYLSAVDNMIKENDDNPTIGLLLCKSKDNFTAEYSLQGITKPIGIAEYATELMKKLEKDFKTNLPTIEEIEAELARSEAINNKILKIKTKK